MKITTARRIAQIFFFGLFIWLLLVATVGTNWSQWRGWPVAWFLQLDPLVSIGTALTTHSLYPPLAWSVVLIVLTVLFGRVFCGFICPFGALHQFVGWLGRRTRRPKDKMAANAYRPAQALKYYILVALLVAAAGNVLQIGWLDPIPLFYRSFNVAVLTAADLAGHPWFPTGRLYVGATLIGVVFVGLVLMNLVVPRFFCRFLCPLGALLGLLGRGTLWSIGKTDGRCTDCGLCDVDCEGACNPTGPIRVSECLMCMNCLDTCPTAAPLAYVRRPSVGGEIASHGLSRRGFAAAVITGAAAIPLARIDGTTKANWSPGLIRPPGSVAEPEFLARCLKCTACLRVCPTNTLQLAGSEHGWQAVWTPVLNNRIGTSGCQLNCIACGQICPTGAIRPFSLEEKLGRADYADRGPIRIGLAAIDRGRCLPWAVDRPCIVCEENCPVTPKAISVSPTDTVVRDGTFAVDSVQGAVVRLKDARLEAGAYASGDYRARIGGEEGSHRIVANTADTLTLGGADGAAPSTPATAEASWRAALRRRRVANVDTGLDQEVVQATDRPEVRPYPADGATPEPAASAGRMESGSTIEILVRLQRPLVDPSRCIGCGVCEHECPISGLRAIRVTADNETRDPAHAVMLKTLKS